MRCAGSPGERHSYHIEITALIDGLLAAARGGSPSVKLVR
jgi:hypothetical protein